VRSIMSLGFAQDPMDKMDGGHFMSGKKSQSAPSVETAAQAAAPCRVESAECKTISVERAAEILGISRAAAYAYAKDGKLPVIRLGSRVLVPKAALDKLLMCP
jgi:excisionase family DNA binding protein